MLLLLFLLLLIILCYLKWKSLKEFWSKKGVPCTDFHPILGSLTFLQRKNPGLWMRDLYNKFDSPYIGIWLFWRPGLVVNCPQLARDILIKDAEVFKDRLLSSGKGDPIGGLNLFTVKDPLWSLIRKRLTPVFTSAKLRALQHLYHSKSSDLIQRIRCDIAKGVKIDLREVYSDYSTDVIGEASFGIKCEATLKGHGALRNTTKEFSKYSIWRGLGWCSIFFLPEVVDVFGFTFFPKQSVAYFKNVFNTIVEKRGGYDKNLNGTNDLLDALVKIKQDSKLENDGEYQFYTHYKFTLYDLKIYEISEDVLLAQAVIFLQAGFDTSSATLSYATYELAYHPHCQETLYEEIAQLKNKLGDKEFDAEDLKEMPYLNCVINEILRKYPIMGWLDRKASMDYKINDNLTIPAGTVVYVNSSGMQMDSKYFPDPELFKPERFLPENEGSIPPYTFMPFGEGPRNCIGKRFGLNTVRYGLASVVLNYKFRPWSNAPLPNDCEVERRGLFYLPGETLSVEFLERN